MNTSDYTYNLPPEKIAIYPLSQRDASKLLVYSAGKITHTHFSSLVDYLPANAFLFFNNTRVIPARLHFRKDSGAVIEIFLLNPVEPSVVISETMASRGKCTWHCAIGNLKRWPSGTMLRKEVDRFQLTASLRNREKGVVEFAWDADESFAHVVHRTGATPLPPYIKRQAEKSDGERYQTVYSHYDGAVAAPTAGLHFTPAVFESLRREGIKYDFLTLHVSAGTFQPIKSDNPEDHMMHEEQIVVSRENVENLLLPDRVITAVGTTSMRTLESLYWFGCKLARVGECQFRVDQNDPYVLNGVSAEDALKQVIKHMEKNRLHQLVGETAIYIRPGYSFRLCKALITNFHQPASTLILLVAAFVGDSWRTIYEEALDKDYRFLSYGDSSLLIP